mmetsp:Transcript_19644/g.34875  ORF Transcript_19644/g.34875 Transcript_19644/m.34875 type:complete len:221 (-) Transcript_19644:106-768(-)
MCVNASTTPAQSRSFMWALRMMFHAVYPGMRPCAAMSACRVSTIRNCPARWEDTSRVWSSAVVPHTPEACIIRYASVASRRRRPFARVPTRISHSAGDNTLGFFPDLSSPYTRTAVEIMMARFRDLTTLPYEAGSWGWFCWLISSCIACRARAHLSGPSYPSIMAFQVSASGASSELARSASQTTVACAQWPAWTHRRMTWLTVVSFGEKLAACISWYSA